MVDRVPARDNPFVVQRTDAIPFDFGDTPFDGMEQFAACVADRHFRGAIRGKHGRGKTTLLCDLHRHLVDKGLNCKLAFVAREKNRQRVDIPALIQRGASGTILLVDGLERLPFVSRQQILFRSRSFGGLIATTHHASWLKTLVHCRTSHRSLLHVLDSLEITDSHLRNRAMALLPQYRGNMRLVLRQLYDDVAEDYFSDD